MGAGLALTAYAAARNLPHAPARLLVFMALKAMDTDAAPACFAGRNTLTEAMGLPADDYGYRSLRRTLSQLREAGLISLVSTAAPGRAARYCLHLDGERRGTLNDPRTEDAQRPPSEVNGGRSRPNGGRSATGTGDAQRPQEEEEEYWEEGSPPSRFCPSHPNGTSTACGACGDARRAAEAWRAPRRPAPPHIHRFDPVSGYCAGCSIREDAA